MTRKREFLVIETGEDVAVYAPSQFPLGTPIGPDAKRLGVDGPSPVQPPAIHLTRPDFDRWRRQLEGEGYSVTLGPFWRNRVSREEAEEAIRRGDTIPLKEAFDELLREAELRRQAVDRRVEAVESRHS
jgi:hypothetical protein